MKRLISLIIMIAACTAAHAQKNVNLSKNGHFMSVSMDLVLSDVKVRHDRAVVLTPVISKGDSIVTLNSVGIYTRNRWYYYKRNGENMITGPKELSYRKNAHPDVVEYVSVIPYSSWMEGAELSLVQREYGCCSKVKSTRRSVLKTYDGPYRPEFVYATPQAEPLKARNISGTAYIDFPPGETGIRPDFRNNLFELGKITAGIDFIREDSDITYVMMSFRGYASPESSYEKNAEIARKRSEALKNYVCSLYPFPKESIHTSFVPEDWEGLRKYVAESHYANRQTMLEIIDGPLEPDAKEWKLKSTYKEEYADLLKHCYPSLRHTDYVIEYTIRSYSEPAEVAEIMKTKPQNLSLKELYAYAQTLETGSPEYNEVFEVAVRMYPEDEMANINAANTAMGRGDMKNALRYLDKAGDSVEAVYARGVYEFICENYEEALVLFEEALAGGLQQAREPIEKIKKQK